MRIGLFIPCYIDAFFPEVGIATLELLERFGHRGRLSARPDLLRPADGQQRVQRRLRPTPKRCSCATSPASTTSSAPSGSCVHHVRDNFDAIEQTDEVEEVRARTYELVEFLHDILKVDAFPWADFRIVSACTTAAARLRQLKHATALRAARAVLLQAAGPAVQGRGYRVRQAGAARRMLRFRRHVLGLRRGRLRQDGLRQGQRPSRAPAPNTSCRPTARA